jgi:hypothetical protein
MLFTSGSRINRVRWSTNMLHTYIPLSIWKRRVGEEWFLRNTWLIINDLAYEEIIILLMYWVELNVLAFSKRWRKQTKKFLQGRNWKACDTLGDGNSKQWKLYNWLNIVNIFKKKDWLFIWKTQKLSLQPSSCYKECWKMSIQLTNSMG